MNFTEHLAALGLALALAPLVITAPAAAQEKEWAVGTPRQNWAHTDSVVKLRPGTVITPASIADRLMIADAFTRWGIAYDEGRLDVVRSSFTKDGVLEVLEASAKPTSILRGIDAIVQAVASDRAHQNDQRRHTISNIVIDKLDGDSATALAYCVVTAAGAGDLYLGATVIYRGGLKKQPDGSWRFVHFVIGMDAYRRLVQRTAAK